MFALQHLDFPAGLRLQPRCLKRIVLARCFWYLKTIPFEMVRNRTKNPVYSREGGFEQLPEVLFRGDLGSLFERCTAQLDVFVHDPLGSFPMDIGDPATEYPRVEYAPIFTIPDHVLLGAARLPIDLFCRLYPREPFKFQGHGPPATVTALIHSTLVSPVYSLS